MRMPFTFSVQAPAVQREGSWERVRLSALGPVNHPPRHPAGPLYRKIARSGVLGFLACFQDVCYGVGPARWLQPPRYAPREGKGEGTEKGGGRARAAGVEAGLR